MPAERPGGDYYPRRERRGQLPNYVRNARFLRARNRAPASRTSGLTKRATFPGTSQRPFHL